MYIGMYVYVRVYDIHIFRVHFIRSLFLIILLFYFVVLFCQYRKLSDPTAGARSRRYFQKYRYRIFHFFSIPSSSSFRHVSLYYQRVYKRVYSAIILRVKTPRLGCNNSLINLITITSTKNEQKSYCFLSRFRPVPRPQRCTGVERAFF